MAAETPENFLSTIAPSGGMASPTEETNRPGIASVPSNSSRPPDGKDAAPTFPPLHDNATSDTGPISSGAAAQPRPGEDYIDDEEPAVAKPFLRTSSPDSIPHGEPLVTGEEDVGEADGEVGKRGRRLVHKMHKFSLYETASRYYIVGGDVTEKRYRILKVDRTTDDDSSTLSVTDDRHVYSQREMNQLLDTIDDGNKGTGGIKLRCTTWGLLGFVKFTGPYYMLLITKKSTVAMIGGHYIYQIEGTELIPLTPRGFKIDQKNTEEPRFLAILNNLDLTRSFYYSYSYDITRTLQYNITKERTALLKGELRSSGDDDFNEMFVWNRHLLEPAAKALETPYDWCRPVTHGHIDQAALSIYGRTAHITLIARRSRYFAGARFLKRGANDLGYVANDVETEQIVSEALTTSFHAPGPRFFANPSYTSYVQHRGSIPLYWTQDNTGVTPKPPIELNLVDPFYGAAALHFDNLFERYGAPIYVLNLVKARERTPRESKLLDEYTKAIAYLNQFLPENRRIIHNAWDMSRAAKSRDQDVIGTLERIAEDVVTTTGFFQNGDGHTSPIRVQNGVARTNCIDCLDRTNAAQFVIGKRALGHQLHALGVLEDTVVNYDTDAVNLFTHMYHDHGDTIAVQYGGSQLVNTMETYRKINQWTSHSRDMIESFKRYYNNSFLDGQRQEAYNLFLGNYIFAQGQPMLWDLATDYYLHHADPRTWLEKRKRDYIHWYTPRFLEERTLPAYRPPKGDDAGKPLSFFDDYWLEYYRPSTLSSFLKMFPFKMNSTIKYIPLKSTQDGRYDLSPFRVRSELDPDANDRKKPKKEVATFHPYDAARTAAANDTNNNDDTASVHSDKGGARRGISLHRWLQPSSAHHHESSGGSQRGGILKGPPSPLPPDESPDVYQRTQQQQEQQNNQYQGESQSQQLHPEQQQQQQPQPRTKPTPLEKSRAAQWTFTKVVHESLNPSVSAQEAEDYARYVAHPHNLPLVVSAETRTGADGDADLDAEYREYVDGSWQTDGLLLPMVSPVGSGGGSLGSAGLPSLVTPLTATNGTNNVEDEHAAYAELLRVGDNPLTVTEEDALKKRYKAYRKWLRGKSLFKQQPVD